MKKKNIHYENSSTFKQLLNLLLYFFEICSGVYIVYLCIYKIMLRVHGAYPMGTTLLLTVLDTIRHFSSFLLSPQFI